MTRFEAMVFAFAAVILTVTLLVPPIVGLADNGDFYKMMSKFGLEHGAQTRDDRYFAYVDTTYVPDPVGSARYQEIWGGTFISSEIVFMAAAVWLNGLLHFGHAFHLQFLGLVHIAALLLGILMLLFGTRGSSKPKRIIGAILSLIVFLDVGYIGYFNSAFTETSSYLFLLFTIAAAAPVMFGKPYASFWILLYFCFSFLLCCSRYPNALMYPMLALFGFVIAIRSRKIVGAAVALTATIVGSYLLFNFIRSVPPPYAELSIYNHFFNALLPFSPQPDHDLKEFGLDQSLLKYSKTTYFQPQSAAYDAKAIAEFRAKVTMDALLKFYRQHPRRVAAALSRSINLGMELQPGYGNYEKKAGKPPGALSQGFVIWSFFRKSLLPKSFGVVALVLVISAVNAVRPWKSLVVSSFRILLLLLCALQLAIVSCTSEPSDIIRHMFLFNLLFDVILVITVIELLFYFGGKLTRSEFEEKARSD